MGAEGYCVNVPWSRGRVGDNDYIFAFQNVVIPIGDCLTVLDFVILLSYLLVDWNIMIKNDA